MDLVIVVDGEPAPKERPRFGKGRTYTPKKTANYEQLIKGYARSAYGMAAPYTGPVRVSVTAYRSVPSSWPKYKRKEAADGLRLPTMTPDTDNFAKAALDGLNKIVFEDDSQVCDLIASKRYSDRPRLEIKVTSLEGKAGAK